MRKLWTPKSYANWARIHKVSETPSVLDIPTNIQLVHDITKYGYTEESQISYAASFNLTSPAIHPFTAGVTGWNDRAHNFLYHLAFVTTAGADNDADARVAFAMIIPNTTGTGTTTLPLSEQYIVPKITSEQTMVGHTLPMPFLCRPYWYPAVFWNGALAASTGSLYTVHIESEE